MSKISTFKPKAANAALAIADEIDQTTTRLRDELNIVYVASQAASQAEDVDDREAMARSLSVTRCAIARMYRLLEGLEQIQLDALHGRSVVSNG